MKWPVGTEARRLCEAYPGKVFWGVAFEALGYPPHWIHTRTEAAKIEAELTGMRTGP